jgi:DNA repair exonuclease SbcCD ATPase subunit
MASTTEQGHNRNAANFDKLIINCTSYGITYNPNKAALKIVAMQAQATAAKNSLTTVNALTPAYKNAVSARVAAFKPFDKLITRVNNALKASDTTQEVDDSAKTIVRKLQGRRATAKKTEEEKKVAADAGKEIVEISTSQMSYDSRLDNFDKLIKLLSSVSQYAPNEADLKITALTALYTDLKAKNLAVINAETPLNNARIARNDVMYKDNVGLVDVAADVKTYIKSVFGATSPQYKTVSSLKFTKYNN